MSSRSGRRSKRRGKEKLTSENISVISASDLYRIRGVVGETNEYDEQNKAKRKMLHLKSKARAKRWKNTIEGSRNAKEEKLQKYREEEEARKTKLDEEEVRKRNEDRQAIIDRSNRLLMESTDRVKTFNRKLLITEVHHERERQKAYKDQLNNFRQARERQFHEQRQKHLEEYNTQQLLQKQYNKQRQNEYSKILSEQLGQVKNQKKEETDRKAEEGRKLVAFLKSEEEAQKRRRIELCIEKKRRAKEYDVMNQQKIKRKKEMERIDQAEQDRVLKFYQDKKKQRKKILERELTRREEKLRRRNKLIDEQAEYLRKLKNDDAERLARQIEEKTQKDNQIEKKKKDKRDELERQIDQSRKRQINRKAVMERNRKEKERKEKRLFKKQAEYLALKDERKKQKKRQYQKRLADFQLRQAEYRKEKERRERESEIREEEMVILQKELEDQKLKEYVGSLEEKYPYDFSPISKDIRKVFRV